MLGYTEDDVIQMIASIGIARSLYVTLPQDENIEGIREGLAMAYDLLDGLLAEGRI